MKTQPKHLWDDTFAAVSNGSADFGNDFGVGSGFGLGVIDLAPPAKPQVPSDPSPPSFSDQHPLPHYPFGFDMKGIKNPFAATPNATPQEQKVKDRALLVKVAFGGAAALAVLAVVGGSKPAPTSVPTSTAPAPRPGNININLQRFMPFGRKKKGKSKK